jgi:hypothetical protein
MQILALLPATPAQLITMAQMDWNANVAMLDMN